MIIDQLNSVSESVWGVVLLVFGGILVVSLAHVTTTHTEAIIGAIGSIIGAGAMAFKGKA